MIPGLVAGVVPPPPPTLHGTIGQDGIARCRDDTIVDCLQVPDKSGYPDPVQRRVPQY